MTGSWKIRLGSSKVIEYILGTTMGTLYYSRIQQMHKDMFF